MIRKYGSRKRPYEEDDYYSECEKLVKMRHTSVKRIETSFSSTIAKYTNLSLQAEINGRPAETQIIGTLSPGDSSAGYIGGDECALVSGMFADGEPVSKALTKRLRDGSTSETGWRTQEGYDEDIDDECQSISFRENDRLSCNYEDKHLNNSLDVVRHNPPLTEDGYRMQLGFQPRDETSLRIGSAHVRLKLASEISYIDESDVDDDMKNDIVLLIDDTSDNEECSQGTVSSAIPSDDYHTASSDISSSSDVCEVMHYDSTCAGLFPF